MGGRERHGMAEPANEHRRPVGKVVAVSGSGNVSQYAVEKVNQLGGKVITLSDSNGTIVDNEGVAGEKWDFLMHLKNVKRGRIKEYAEKFGCEYFEGDQSN